MKNSIINDIYLKIKQQRNTIFTDVDKYGLISIPTTLAIEEYRFLLLVHLLLSSQTKDIYTHASVMNFINNGVLNCSEVLKRKHEIKSFIKKVGFANTKTLYILEFAEEFQFKSMPQTFEELLRIKGVGEKMSFLYLKYACGINQGIGVDTHVFRVSNRIGLTTKNAMVCERSLKELFNKEEWGNINNVLVGFGQDICTAQRPKCNKCIVKYECPSSTCKISKLW